ncbi:acetolactate decarboxylase [Weissella cibaria]|uniref:acetolactate decarboxylase n=1 Tax=Weissella cibaria TaxID=137591 RepID=UPI0007067A29|nr:acetolactate decarboxylase [Weissella cibaria]ALI33233.1 alpha-acetolactate decarboxylase [Weissella cibaria]
MTTVYQHGTLEALIAGQLGGTLQLSELLTHGDTGIGTLHGVDGEVVILDGEVYQADATGTVNHITDLTATTPFSTVHDGHHATEQITWSDVTMANIDLIEKRHLANNFSAIVLHGVMDQVLVRVAPKANEPFPSLLELTKNQPTFERAHVAGTLVGYYSPELYQGATSAGWHVHFISDDRQFAGHVLEFSAAELTGELTIFDDFQLHLPVNDASFRAHEAVNMAELDADIHAAEDEQPVPVLNK